MNKNIFDLNITDEDKILLSSIEKKILFLSEKTKEYFDKAISISSDRIEEAYSINRNLVSILKKKKELASNVEIELYRINSSHAESLTKEINLNILQTSMETRNIFIIENTLESKDKLISYEDKSDVLSKKHKYLKSKSKKDKKDFEESLVSLEAKIENDKVLDIEPLKEDVNLIKNLIDLNEIAKYKLFYYLLFVILFISFVGLVSLWTVGLII